MFKIAIYSRKSKFTGKGDSIGNQIELCKKYIKTKFLDINDNDILVYEDEGFSGGNIQRPHFKMMINDAKNKIFDAIVCYRLDRISRNIGDFAKLIEELNDLNISFISIKEEFDTSSPMGRAMMYIASVFSQLERETIAERIRDNMHELAKTGRWLGGTTPLGYISENVQSVSIDGKKNSSCKLKLVEDEAKTVKLIFEKFLEFNSLTKTETYLINNGYKTRSNNDFSRFGIKNILTNPVYIIADEKAYNYFIENKADLFSGKEEFNNKYGVMAYNRTFQKQGKAHIFKDINEWIVSVGKHKGIINSTDWIRVQELLEGNKSKSFNRKPRTNTALLSGLLFCGNCGNHMRPKSTNKTIEGIQQYNYLCEMKERSRLYKCAIKNPQGNTLDEFVCKEIMSLSSLDSEFIKQLEVGKKMLGDNNKNYEKDLLKLEKELEINKNEINNLISVLSKPHESIAEVYIFERIKELDNEKIKIETNIKELKELISNSSISNIEFDVLLQFLSSFKNNFDSMSLEQKRLSLRNFVKRVVWDGENVHIFMCGSNEKIEYPINKFEDGELSIVRPLKNHGYLEPMCEHSK